MQDIIEKNKELSSRFEGFDFLRAFFSIVVVALHANIFNILSTEKLKLVDVANVLNINFGYLSVPVFLQISLFLFYINREKYGQKYFSQKRLPRLVSLYFFWSLLKIIFDFVLNKNTEIFRTVFSSTSDTFLFVISGGHTIFYFFFSLLFTTTICEFLVIFEEKRKIKLNSVKLSYLLLFLSCVLIFCFPLIDIYFNKKEVFTYVANPLNFLPYVFTAKIVAQEFISNKLKKLTSSLSINLSLLFAFCVSLIIFEWIFLKDLPHYSRLFPNYSRISLVFVSFFLLYISVLSTRSVPTIINFISKYSLGIYGFHIFFIDYVVLFDNLSPLLPSLITITKFVIALLGSIVLSLVFKKFKLTKEFV